MSLDVYLEDPTSTYDSESLYWANITHNLGSMAQAADIYKALWRPEEIECKRAKDIVSLLEVGLAKLKANPEEYKKYNSENGWGMYKHFVPFIEEYLEACKEYPEAIIKISR